MAKLISHKLYPSPLDFGAITSAASNWKDKRGFAEAVLEKYGFIPSDIKMKNGSQISSPFFRRLKVLPPVYTVSERSEKKQSIFVYYATGIHQVVDKKKFEIFKELVNTNEYIRQQFIEEQKRDTDES